MLISRQERARICSDPDLGAGNVLARLAAYDRPRDEVVLRMDGTWRAPDGSYPTQLTLGQLQEVVETYAGWYAAQGVRPRDPVARWRAGHADADRPTLSPSSTAGRGRCRCCRSRSLRSIRSNMKRSKAISRTICARLSGNGP